MSARRWAASSQASAAVPETCLDSFGGIQNCFGYLGGALAPTLTGYVVQATGSLTTPLLIGAAIPMVGAVLYWFMPTGPIAAVDLVHADRNVLPAT